MPDYPTKCTVCGEEKELIRVRGAGMWCEGCVHNHANDTHTELDQQKLKEVMSSLGKLSHKKSPRGSEYFRTIQKRSVEARKANKQK